MSVAASRERWGGGAIAERLQEGIQRRNKLNMGRLAASTLVTLHEGLVATLVPGMLWKQLALYYQNVQRFAWMYAPVEPSYS